MDEELKRKVSLFVRKIEIQTNEVKEEMEKLKDVFKEAKEANLDVKILKKLVAWKAMEKNKRDEEDFILACYKDALADE